jgi:hypothetical protein
VLVSPAWGVTTIRECRNTEGVFVGLHEGGTVAGGSGVRVSSRKRRVWLAFSSTIVARLRSATTSGMVHLDVPNGALELDKNVVERLRDAAAEKAGHSSSARDLSLVLARALRGRRGVALRRAEVQTLMDVADAAGLSELRDLLARDQ